MKKPLILGKIVCLKILKPFDKIGKVEPHGAQVYKKDKKYYYRDTLHFGKKAHLEVFDRKGNHLGEADPLTGEIKPHSADSKKKLSKEYR